MWAVSELIDTTEMYLRTIFELSEEGIRPMRARIAERLAQSGPTVSQTVARMQRDGLVEVDQDDRHLVLTPRGAQLAVQVMRKHRLAECLLIEVIGLPWEQVHAEACRWEHVMSESVERRLVDLLDHPTRSPFGNPIPGLSGLAEDDESDLALPLPGASLPDVASETPRTVPILRIAETLQPDESIMWQLHRIGAIPGSDVTVEAVGGAFRVSTEAGAVELPAGQAAHVVVAVP
jgi:DtxR family transcriptional regulator, iron-dependent repressor